MLMLRKCHYLCWYEVSVSFGLWHALRNHPIVIESFPWLLSILKIHVDYFLPFCLIILFRAWVAILISDTRRSKSFIVQGVMAKGWSEGSIGRGGEGDEGEDEDEDEERDIQS